MFEKSKTEGFLDIGKEFYNADVQKMKKHDVNHFHVFNIESIVEQFNRTLKNDI